MGIVVYEYIEGLCLGTEFGTLQITPSVADGAQLACGTIAFRNFYGLF